MASTAQHEKKQYQGLIGRVGGRFAAHSGFAHLRRAGKPKGARGSRRSTEKQPNLKRLGGSGWPSCNCGLPSYDRRAAHAPPSGCAPWAFNASKGNGNLGHNCSAWAMSHFGSSSHFLFSSGAPL